MNKKLEPEQLDLSEAAEKEAAAREALEPEEAAPAALGAAVPPDPAPATRAAITAAEQQKALQRPGTEMQGRTVRADLQVGNRGLTLGTLAELWRFSECVIQSKMFPQVTTPQQALIAIELGQELGIPPLQAIQNIAVINGRATLWGDAMLGVCFASSLLAGIEEKIEGEGDGMIAHCTVRRRGFEEPTTRSYSVMDAKKADLWGKNTWIKYPKRMLQMRARGFALRDLFPDVLKGLITREEAEDLVIEGRVIEDLPAQDRARFGFPAGPPTGSGL